MFPVSLTVTVFMSHAIGVIHVRVLDTLDNFMVAKFVLDFLKDQTIEHFKMIGILNCGNSFYMN